MRVVVWVFALSLVTAPVFGAAQPSPRDRLDAVVRAQATLDGTGTGATEDAACRAARAAAELACVYIGRDGDARGPCACTPRGGGFSCTVVAECIPKW